MPLLAGLVLALDAACIVHALRARQPYYWFAIILGLPTIGAAIYFFSEILPDLAHSRAAREATGALRLSDTAENRKRLAEALYATERYDEARTLYETALEGAHANDPALMMGLARSLFGLKDYGGVCDTLDRLREANPDFESAEGHMLYARSREGMGDLDQAAVEYETLSGYYPGEEARCRHGMLLLRMGR
ncbi:MAG: tetratricopeptide repeat protein, partial [Alphaproteobacteria bacterium]|nr:tetratricopeptide repeat protein [Alphaproteobacteria bacterium]